jgi:hypothetical protein
LVPPRVMPALLVRAIECVCGCRRGDVCGNGGSAAGPWLRSLVMKSAAFFARRHSSA